MQLLDYVAILRRQWRLVLVFLVAGAVIGIAQYVRSTPSYEARATMMVTVNATATNPTQAYDGSLLAQQLAKAYPTLVQDSSVARDTVNRLGLTMSVPALQAAISAHTVTDTNLFVLLVQDSSAGRAQRIANTLASVLAAHVKDVQTITPKTLPAAEAVLIDPASLPTHPTTPGPSRLALFGGVLGLLAGFGVALVRDRGDTRVRTANDVWRASGMRTLGSLETIPEARGGAATELLDLPSDAQVRRLQTNVQLAAGHPASSSILVTSPSSEDGKTTVACALARALSLNGKRVVLVDADLRRLESPSRLRGRRSRGRRGRPAGLSDVLQERSDLEGAITEWEGGSLDVLMSGSAVENPSELLSQPTLELTVRALEARYDHVIIDAPAVLPAADAVVVSQLVSGVVVVVRHGSTKQDDLRQTMANLDLVDAPVLGAVLNMVPTTHRAHSAAAPGPGPGAVHAEPPAAETAISRLRAWPPHPTGGTGTRIQVSAIDLDPYAYPS